MSTILHLLRGQMSSPVNHLGGRCPHIPFFTGGQMSEGGNVPKIQKFVLTLILLPRIMLFFKPEVLKNSMKFE